METNEPKKRLSRCKQNLRKFRLDGNISCGSDLDLCDSLLSDDTKNSKHLLRPRLRSTGGIEDERNPREESSALIPRRVSYETNVSTLLQEAESSRAPLLKKSILVDGKTQILSSEKTVSYSVNHSRSNSIQQEKTEIKIDFPPEKDQSAAAAARAVRRKSKAENLKTIVHFGESPHLLQTCTISGGKSFFQQRASFQSETGNRAQCVQSTDSLNKRAGGIVCSNNDLRLILCEAHVQRRYSADARRDVMKSNRSMSFDSSFRYRKGSHTGTVTKVSTTAGLQPETETKKNVIEIKVTSDSSPEEIAQSSDIPQKTLAVTLNENIFEASTSSSECQENDQSQVPWDDQSIIDATVLGTAIEAYLTSTSRHSPEDPLLQEADITSDLALQDGSLCSSLKSLFVK